MRFTIFVNNHKAGHILIATHNTIRYNTKYRTENSEKNSENCFRNVVIILKY